MLKKWFILLIISLFLITSCGNKPEITVLPMEANPNAAAEGLTVEDVTLTTSDSVDIKATLYNANSKQGIILLHMLGKDRDSWKDFSTFLQSQRYTVLAIDLRGHGESSLDYKTFSEQDYSNMANDVDAAMKYLKGLGSEEITIIGASIGANTALNYAASDQEIKNIVLLSPGLDYHGVKTDDSITKYTGKVLIIAGSGDAYSADSSKTLDAASAGEHKLVIYDTKEHGTNMLGKNLGVEEEIFDWVK